MGIREIICLLGCGIGIAAQGYAQHSYDTSYIEDHTKEITIRTYGSYKFTGYNLGQAGYGNSLPFKSNDNINVGVGFNYRNVGLNVAVKAPFINDDNDQYGKTRFLDLQSYLYLRKWNVDLYAQLYKGYYLSDDGLLPAPLPQHTYLLRPDLRTATLGFNIQYIFNYKRFSYRAAYLQNEYQKKSAGSFIVGSGMHYMHVRADSAIIPSIVADENFIAGSDFDKSRIFCFVLNGGYGYTWVIKNHFFLMGAIMTGIGINTTSLNSKRQAITETGTGLQLNGTARMAAGYNSSVYYVGVQFVEFTTRSNMPLAESWQGFETGNFRIVFAKRFSAKKSFIKEAYEKAYEKIPGY